MNEEEYLDRYPLSYFEVDCDGSVCGSPPDVPRHKHRAQDGWPPICRVRITDRRREYLEGPRRLPTDPQNFGDAMRLVETAMRERGMA